MSQTLKLAFVGCGAIAPYHLNGIKEHAPRIQVTAAIDPNRAKSEEIAAETGAQVFGSLEEGLAHGDFDAVDVLTPHHLHEPLAIQAFAAGKHVVLEKPMATTLAACDRIFAAAKQAGTVFMLAENAQYWPEIVKAQELIEQGAIGDIITARAAFFMPLDPYWFQDEQPWRMNRDMTGGGITIDGGSHWLRPLRMWLGEVDEVVAVLDHPVAEMQGESHVRSLMRFRSGKYATYDALMVDYEGVMAPEPWWRVTGTKGELLIEGGLKGGALYIYDREHPEGTLVQEPLGYPQSFGPELADFAAAVLDGKSLEAGPEESLGELRLALAIYRSAETHQWEKVWD